MFFFIRNWNSAPSGAEKSGEQKYQYLKKHWWAQSLKRGYPSDNEEETEQKETEDEGKAKNDEMFKKKRACF